MTYINNGNLSHFINKMNETMYKNLNDSDNPETNIEETNPVFESQPTFESQQNITDEVQTDSQVLVQNLEEANRAENTENALNNALDRLFKKPLGGTKLFGENTDVNVLSEDDFEIIDDTVRIKQDKFPHTVGIVMVYADWCPHCRSKEKCMNAMANDLQKLQFRVCVLNSDDNSNIVRSLNLVGYPTFYAYDDEQYKLVEISNLKSWSDLLDQYLNPPSAF
jgi:thiol-disulfide isomerase/thioredoxin